MYTILTCRNTVGLFRCTGRSEADATAGISIHRMADQYDSGKILYSGHGVTIPSDPDFRQVISAYERIVPLAVTRAISRALMEEEGTPQSGPIGSQGWMRPEFLWVHQSAGVESVHNQVRTFRFGTSGRQGPIAYVDGAWIELLQTARTASINSTQMRCADGYLYIEQSRPARFSISPPGWIRD